MKNYIKQIVSNILTLPHGRARVGLLLIAIVASCPTNLWAEEESGVTPFDITATADDNSAQTKKVDGKNITVATFYYQNGTSTMKCYDGNTVSKSATLDHGVKYNISLSGIGIGTADGSTDPEVDPNGTVWAGAKQTFAMANAEQASNGAALYLESNKSTHCYKAADGPIEIYLKDGRYVINDEDEFKASSITKIYYYEPHTTVAIPAVKSTATATGNIAHWGCSVCGKHFSDAAGLNEMAAGSWLTPVGEGTVESPYLITSAYELCWFRDYVNETYDHASACAKLQNNIDLSTVCHAANAEAGIEKVDWEPIAKKGGIYGSNKWEGTFDGNGKTISNLYINNNSDYNAFFGIAGNNSVIENLKLENVYVSGNYNAAGLASYGLGTIDNIEIVSGTIVSTGANAAGITTNCNHTISNCINRANVSSTKNSGATYVAGIVSSSGGNILKCSNYGEITASQGIAAGITVNNSGMSDIINCANYGTIKIGNNTATQGGPAAIVANPWYTTLVNCANFGDIYVGSGSTDNCGFIAGKRKLKVASGNFVNSGKLYLDGVEQSNIPMLANGMSWANDNEDNTSVEYTATAAELATGKYAMILQNYCSEPTWGQTLTGENADAYPVIGGSAVYASHIACNGKPASDAVYTNDQSAVTTDSHNVVNGICTLCNEFDAPQGEGTTASPYQIANAGNLLWFMTKASTANETNKTAYNAILTADITINQSVLNADGSLNGTPAIEWIVPACFYGTFDGKKHTISGIYSNVGGYNNNGMFNYNYGTICNLGVLDSYIGDHNNCKGTFAAVNYGKITNCYSFATIAGNGYGGGIAGQSEKSEISNCFYAGKMTSTSSASGPICCDNTSSGDITNPAVHNNFFLAGSLNEGMVNVRSTSVTADEMASGKVAAMLQAGCTADTWGQKLTGETPDAYPVLGGAKVYANNLLCDGKTPANGAEFSNTECENPTVAAHTYGDATVIAPTCMKEGYDLHVCSVCGDEKKSDFTAVTGHKDEDEDGLCDVCDKLVITTAPVLVTTENYASLGLTADYVGYKAISNLGQLAGFADEMGAPMTLPSNNNESFDALGLGPHTISIPAQKSYVFTFTPQAIDEYAFVTLKDGQPSGATTLSILSSYPKTPDNVIRTGQGQVDYYLLQGSTYYVEIVNTTDEDLTGITLFVVKPTYDSKAMNVALQTLSEEGQTEGAEQVDNSIKYVLTDDIVVNKNLLDEDGRLVEKDDEGNDRSFLLWNAPSFYIYDKTTAKYTPVIFDGNNHTISGLYQNEGSNAIRDREGNNDRPELFGFISEAGFGSKIKNLGITDSYFAVDTDNGAYSGTIVACNYGDVSNCSSDATLHIMRNSWGYHGGLVSYQGAGSITGSSFNGHIIGDARMYAGGIANYVKGEQGEVNITDCHFSGTVVNNCSGTFYSGSRFGGIAYTLYPSDYNINVDNSYADGNIINKGSNFSFNGMTTCAFIADYSFGITNCYNAMTVKNSGQYGYEGLIGRVYKSSYSENPNYSGVGFCFDYCNYSSSASYIDGPIVGSYDEAGLDQYLTTFYTFYLYYASSSSSGPVSAVPLDSKSIGGIAGSDTEKAAVVAGDHITFNNPNYPISVKETHFNNGELAYCLNYYYNGVKGNSSPQSEIIWYQNLDSDKHPVLNGDEYTVVYVEDDTFYNKERKFDEYELTDGTKYDLKYDFKVGTLTYKRSFSNSTYNALYVPFAIPVSALNDAATGEPKAKIYSMLNVFEEDTDDNGSIDKWVLKVIRLRDNESTKPNTPYIIKPETNGAFTLTLSDVVLSPAEEKTIWCASANNIFEFTGTYAKKHIDADSYFFMSGGGLKSASEGGTNLGAQRWFMAIKDKETGELVRPSSFNTPSQEAKTIQIVVDDDDATGISDVNVSNANRGGKYIKNGTVVIMKNGREFNLNGQELK